ncbi:hypothetical protein M378DRAFT_182254 [Amanita muscaria Koide BX008]|uniref:Uncharacterized protein n=1 Tax=Amanita muscaria (strain Koide BX008) TaxID=946122 RepID=A0A0C2WGV9_AMAMK|nr:hypothetical protein M378DRAFT_182254 [Amanita muscaria Koide BX008]
MHHWRKFSTPPPESSDETSDTHSSSESLATQLFLIMEKLTLLELSSNTELDRFDRIEQLLVPQSPSCIRVRTTTGSDGVAASPRQRQGQASFVSFTDAPASASAIAIALNCHPSVGPETPRRTARDQSTVTPCLPKHQGSARPVRAQTPEAHSFTPHREAAVPIQPQYLSDAEDEIGEMRERPSKGMPQPNTLPAHYFRPDPIITPEQISHSLLRAQDGAYFVVTQGLEPGVYRNWHETAAVAKSVGGVWTKVPSKDKAISTYQEAYLNGFCKRIYR